VRCGDAWSYLPTMWDQDGQQRTRKVLDRLQVILVFMPGPKYDSSREIGIDERRTCAGIRCGVEMARRR
jgi:hypothetical protein